VTGGSRQDCHRTWLATGLSQNCPSQTVSGRAGWLRRRAVSWFLPSLYRLIRSPFPPLASLTSGLYSACAATYGMAWCAGVAPRAHVQRRRTCYPDRSRAYACDRLGHVNLICQSVKSNQSAIGKAQVDLAESLPKHVRVPYTLIWTSRTAIKAMLFFLSCIYGSLEMLYADACEFR